MSGSRGENTHVDFDLHKKYSFVYFLYQCFCKCILWCLVQNRMKADFIFHTIRGENVIERGTCWVKKVGKIWWEYENQLQRYAHISQRFNAQSPNYSAYNPLGWIDMEKIVYAKKQMFLRNICIMKEQETCTRVLKSRTIKFQESRDKNKLNEMTASTMNY